MKRIAQFAALVVVMLLAGLPAAEVLTCPLRVSRDAAACPMGMSGVHADCPMAQQVARNKCLRDCCNCGLPKLVGPIAVPVQLKQGTPVQFVALDAPGQDAERAVAAAQDGPAVSSSPPRYILNRVFRI